MTCLDDSRCLRAGVHGTCEPSSISGAHFCVFADSSCPTGQRWDKTAGDGLAKQCVATATDVQDMAMPPAPQPNGVVCVTARRTARVASAWTACAAIRIAAPTNVVRAICRTTLAHVPWFPLADGPAAGHPTCGPDAKSTCMRDGTCDGAGACRLWAAGTVCGQSTCDSGTVIEHRSVDLRRQRRLQYRSTAAVRSRTSARTRRAAIRRAPRQRANALERIRARTARAAPRSTGLRAEQMVNARPPSVSTDIVATRRARVSVRRATSAGL